MKEIEKKDEPEVSGGHTSDGGCFPMPVGFPPGPIVPFPDPIPNKTDDLM